MKNIGIVQDPVFMEHRPGSYHPESPSRLFAAYELLKSEEIRSLFETLNARMAKREEIQLIHTSGHFDRVASTEGFSTTYLDPDTVTSERSFEAALYAAGGVLEGIDRIMAGDFGEIFALVRPPGHHAESDRAKGFCLFNNIAIGAMYAIENYGIERILIADWDLHHGNGTQHSFYSDPRVLYFSTHQYPYYPGTGSFVEVGTGDGRGFTVNVPLGIGFGDYSYYLIYKTLLEPIAAAFRPQLVLVSAGFDTYYLDPLGGMEVTPVGFSALAHLLHSIARSYADGRLLITLEGGYHIEGQAESIGAIIKTLANTTSSIQSGIQVGSAEKSTDPGNRRIEAVIESVISIQKEFWNCF